MGLNFKGNVSGEEAWRLFLRQPVPTYIVDLKPVLKGLRALDLDSLSGLEEYLVKNPELARDFLNKVKVLAANPAALELVEADDEQDFIDNFPDFLFDESVRALRTALVQVADGKDELEETTPIITRSGRKLVVQFYMRPLYDGDLSQVICNCIEVSHWKRAEEALGREQETLKGSPVFSFRWRNAEGWPVESVSPNIVELGYTQDELLTGRVHFAEMVHKGDLQRVGAEVVQYSATGQNGFEQDYRIYTASGEVRWIYDYTSIVRDPNGDITHYDGFLLDITARKQAEQALRASEQRYQEMFEANPVSIWVEDVSGVIPVYQSLRQQGVDDFYDYFSRHPELIFELAGRTRVLDVNAATVAMFEAESKSELMGSLEKVFCADSLEGSIAVHAALAGGQSVVEVETVNQTLTGRRLNVLIKINIPADTDYRNLLVTMVDITDRKQVEEKLAASELELATIFENMQDTYYRTDSQGVLVRVGPGVKQMLGYEPEELLGVALSSLYAEPQQRDEFLHALNESGGKVSAYHTKLLNRQGEQVWVSSSSQYLYDGDGAVLGVEGIARDITEQVKTMQALAESERRQAEANRIARMGHLDRNLDNGELVWSKEMYGILGITDTAMAADSEVFLSCIAENDRDEIMQDVQEKINTGGCYAHRFAIRDLHGNEKYLESKAEIFVVDDERHMIGYVRDITEENKIANELRKARDEAEQANRLKSDFLANMSHEIRTPMNGVVGFVNLLSRTDLDSEQRDYLETMKTSMGDLMAIINDILDFSRIESDKLTIHHAEFDLLEAVSDVISLFSASANSKGLELGMVLGENVPLTVEGDPVRLRQILSNLIGNAIKFTDRGEVNLRVTLDSNHGDDFIIHFQVEDTGVGIAESDMEHLFDAFTQIHTGRAGGTGLGLAISRRLVELMGGDISVRPRANGGSIFAFTLPLTRLHQQARVQPSHAALALQDYAGKRVLVVDDNAINRKLITTLLGKMGVDTVEAEDGHGAIACHEGDNFDLIMMDIRMPGMDGVEATRQIRLKESRHQRIPIIALTAHALPHERENFILAGMDDCLTKPVREEDLLGLLEGYME